MAIWITILDRVAITVGVAIPRQRVARPGHDTVRLDEASQARVVPACAVVVQAQNGLLALTGEAVAYGSIPCSIAQFSPGGVEQTGILAANDALVTNNQTCYFLFLPLHSFIPAATHTGNRIKPAIINKPEKPFNIPLSTMDNNTPPVIQK
jgi:hypothetical protein